jgi:hypothetical protein
VAQRNLIAGFSVVGFVYAIGFVTATWPVRISPRLEATQAN